MHHLVNLGIAYFDVIQSATYGELLIALLLVTLIGVQVFRTILDVLKRWGYL